MLSNGKPDWAKILDRTLGPRRIAYKPLQVGLGKPDGTPSASGSALTAIPAEDVPTPTANPLRRAKNEIREKLQKTAEANAVGAIPQETVQRPGSAVDTSNVSPGAIFRKGLDFTVPVPAPSPRK